VIITAKDAVKLAARGNDPIADNIWVLEIEAQLENDFVDRLAAQLHSLNTEPKDSLLGKIEQ